MTDFTASFGKPFAQQIAAWRIRLANQVTTPTWDAMMHSAHDRAFTVAGAMKAELLADLAEAVDKAIVNGGTLESFRKDFRAIVEKNGWHGWAGEGSKKGEAWRTKVIYKTNLATSYAAGRLAQLREAGFTFFVYRHGGSVEPRIQHLGWDGLVLKADHPFWATHAPPNGWGCSCYITGARSREGARRVGGKPDKQLDDGWQAIDPKTGVPVGIDKGWAYAPGGTVSDDIIAAVKAKLDRLPEGIARDLQRDLERPGSAAATGASALLSWRDWPTVKTLGDVIRAALASGVAKQVVVRRSFPVEGVRQYLNTAAEITQRFALPSLEVFASADDLPFKVRNMKRAAAFYVSQRRSMGVKLLGVTPAKAKAAFDVDPGPEAIARWKSMLAAAAPDVRALAERMSSRRWSVVRDVRGVASHEYGHHLHYSNRSEIDALIRENRMLEDGWPLLISTYSGVNREEFIAESFALYLTGDEDQFFRIHPALLAWLRRREGKS